MIFPCMEPFLVIFQVSHDFQCLWEPCESESLLYSLSRKYIKQTCYMQNLNILASLCKGASLVWALPNHTPQRQILGGLNKRYGNLAALLSRALLMGHWVGVIKLSQGSYRQVCIKFKDFLRTSEGFTYGF